MPRLRLLLHASSTGLPPWPSHLWTAFLAFILGGCSLFNPSLNLDTPPALDRQKHSILAVAFSPNGGTLAAADGTPPGEVSLWDPVNGQRQHLLRETGLVYNLAFSPDGRLLATAGYLVYFMGPGRPLTAPTAGIWEAHTGKKLLDLGMRRNINALAFAPDGTTLAIVREDGTVTLCDVATGKERLLMPERKERLYAVTFSPNGALVAVGGEDGIVRLFDAKTGRQKPALAGHRTPVHALAFLPDGKSLVAAGGSDGSREASLSGELKIWDVGTGQARHDLGGHAEPVLSVAVTLDGHRLASGSREGTVRVWETDSGKECFALKGLMNFTSLAFSPDGKLLATAEGTGDLLISSGGLKLWDATTGKRHSINGQSTGPGPATPRMDRKENISAEIVEALFGQEHCRAKVGQVVHFSYGFPVVPPMMIHHLKVEVDGKVIDEPELANQQTNPGYGEMTYVFRPKHRGAYQVKVTPVYDFGEGAGGSWIVDVFEEGDASVPPGQ